jgi:hypothetical protein
MHTAAHSTSYLTANERAGIVPPAFVLATVSACWRAATPLVVVRSAASEQRPLLGPSTPACTRLSASIHGVIRLTEAGAVHLETGFSLQVMATAAFSALTEQAHNRPRQSPIQRSHVSDVHADRFSCCCRPAAQPDAYCDDAATKQVTSLLFLTTKQRQDNMLQMHPTVDPGTSPIVGAAECRACPADFVAWVQTA